MQGISKESSRKKAWENPEIWDLSIDRTEMQWRGEGVDNIWLEIIEHLTRGRLEFGNDPS